MRDPVVEFVADVELKTVLVVPSSWSSGTIVFLGCSDLFLFSTDLPLAPARSNSSANYDAEVMGSPPFENFEFSAIHQRFPSDVVLVP